MDAGAPDDIATGAHNARTALRPAIAIGEKIISAAMERFRRCNGPNGVPARDNSCSIFVEIQDSWRRWSEISTRCACVDANCGRLSVVVLIYARTMPKAGIEVNSDSVR